MSGHSKWSNIKRTKEKSDGQKAKIFTKIGREIMVAIKEGGADAATNTRLRLAISKAKQNNMPSDRINNMLKKSVSDADYIEQVYEGYGIGGVAVIVECLTDNKNRTAGDVRHIFDKYGGSLGSTGCVSFLFETKGTISIEKSGAFNEDDIVDTAILNGALDYEDDGDVFVVYTEPNEFSALVGIYEQKGYTVLSSDNEKIPASFIALSNEQRERFDRMMEMFEENDDVQNTYTNIEEKYE